MRKRMKRPSPAMLVAVTALVSSFAGPAVADEVARVASHISGKHIKNNSVTSADVRNNSLSEPDIRDGGIATEDIGTGEVHTVDLGDNAVRGDKVQANTLDGSDIIDNALGGREVNEDALGKVGSAANADAADKARNAERAEVADRVEGLHSLSVVLRHGESRTLVDTGELRVYAVCNQEQGNDDPNASADAPTTYATLYVATTREDTQFSSDEGSGPIGPSSSADDREIEYASTDSGTSSDESEFTLVTPDGSSVISGTTVTFANGDTDTCTFGGFASSS